MSRPPDRHMSPHALQLLLGGWHRGGPAYVALGDALRAALLAGSLPLSTRLPSERELAVALGVSRTTTTGAYQRLRDEGFLVSRRGSGTVTTLPATTGTGLDSRRPASASNRTRQGRDTLGDPVDLSLAAPPAPPALHAGYLAALAWQPRTP